jgi:bifunctional DNA-binding transcriptional regulator/antitoxin component of YhaV-PrlF toxin-antitoxin module
MVILQADTRRRITLPASAGIKPGDAMKMEVLEDGRILLVPVAAIPKHQLWAWVPETKKAVAESLADTRPSTTVETADDVESIAGRWSGED